MSAPAGWMVAERRGGEWLFHPDYVAFCVDRAEADKTAESWRQLGRVVGVFELVSLADARAARRPGNVGDVA